MEATGHAAAAALRAGQFQLAAKGAAGQVCWVLVLTAT